MKRFVTIFATLVMGATLFTTAMAQGKPAAQTDHAKKHVMAHTMKKAAAKHVQKLSHKKATLKKLAIHKASGKSQKSEKSIPKAKAKKALSRTLRTRSSHSVAKPAGKRSGVNSRTPIRLAARGRAVNNGIVKSPTAPKAGKVVNRQ
jgi:hypothetical protein